MGIFYSKKALIKSEPKTKQILKSIYSREKNDYKSDGSLLSKEIYDENDRSLLKRISYHDNGSITEANYEKGHLNPINSETKNDKGRTINKIKRSFDPDGTEHIDSEEKWYTFSKDGSKTYVKKLNDGAYVEEYELDDDDNPKKLLYKRENGIEMRGDFDSKGSLVNGTKSYIDSDGVKKEDKYLSNQIVESKSIKDGKIVSTTKGGVVGRDGNMISDKTITSGEHDSNGNLINGVITDIDTGGNREINTVENGIIKERKTFDRDGKLTNRSYRENGNDITTQGEHDKSGNLIKGKKTIYSQDGSKTEFTYNGGDIKQTETTLPSTQDKIYTSGTHNSDGKLLVGSKKTYKVDNGTSTTETGRFKDDKLDIGTISRKDSQLNNIGTTSIKDGSEYKKPISVFSKSTPELNSINDATSAAQEASDEAFSLI